MLPQLQQTAESITMVNAFSGVNKTQTVSEGEFSDTKNITNDYYPALGNRKLRGKMSALTDVKAMIGGEFSCYVARSKTDTDTFALFYNDREVVSNVTGADNTCLCIMGAYIVMFPDGIIYNTSDGTYETIENTTNVTGASFNISTSEGASYTDIVISDTAPSSPSDGTYWKDTSTTPAVLKVWSQTYAMWSSVATAYTTITADGIGAGFNVYDAVAIDGITGTYASSNTEASGAYYILYAVSANAITIAGTIEAGTQAELTVKRVKPDIDYMCELDNRIWGCKQDGHEILACKQGDPKNWYCYAGITSDSYAVSIGTQGEFSGCASYGGYVYFFKEAGYHKIYGTKPSNYEVAFKQTRGVQLNSSKSIAHVGDYLFYKAKDAVVMFDGSSTVVSQKLGSDRYFEAVASGYRDKYYISMRNADNEYYLFVYDITKATWILEDDVRIAFMADTNKNGLYMAEYPDSNGVSSVWTVNEEKIYTTIFPLGIYEDTDVCYPQRKEIKSFYIDSNGKATGKTFADGAAEFGKSEDQIKSYLNERCWYPCAGKIYTVKPDNPSVGTYYHDEDEDKYYKYDGTDWTEVSAPESASWYPMYITRDGLIEDSMDWSFTTGDIGLDTPLHKYIKRIILRVMLDTKTNMTVEVMYDDSDAWERLMDYNCTRKRSFEIPMQVRRCDHLKLRFTGHGTFKLYSIAKATEEGSGL